MIKTITARVAFGLLIGVVMFYFPQAHAQDCPGGQTPAAWKVTGINAVSCNPQCAIGTIFGSIAAAENGCYPIGYTCPPTHTTYVSSVAGRFVPIALNFWEGYTTFGHKRVSDNGDTGSGNLNYKGQCPASPKYFVVDSYQSPMAADLGSNCESDSPRCINGPDPINPSNGNEALVEDDIQAPARSIAFRRFYNSLDTGSGSLGSNWQHSYSRHLSVQLLPSQKYSPQYNDQTEACVSGWSQLRASSQGRENWNAVFTNGTCILFDSNGVNRGRLPIYSNSSFQKLKTIDANRDDGARLRAVRYGDFSMSLLDVEVGTTERFAALTNGYKLTDDADNVELYDITGKLLTVTDRRGNTQTLSYSGSNGKLSSVTDNFGHSLTFGYDPQARLQTVTDSAGRVTQYDYDTNGRLVMVTRPDATYREYAYNSANWVSGITSFVDENRQTVFNLGYDSFGRVTTSQLGGVSTAMTFVYNPDGSTTQTDPLGAVRTFGFQQVGGHRKSAAVTGSPCPECGYKKAISYDTNGFVASITDYNDHVTTYVHDARGLETSRTEAFGTPQARTITTTWHATYRLPTQITEPGRTTAFTYDSSGNQLTKTVTDTATSTARAWTFTYDNLGRRLTADGPRTDVSDVTTYTYYSCTTGGACGQLHTVTNALGHVTTFNSFDANGRPLVITDPNGVATTLTYHPRGWLSSSTIDGKTTSYLYDGAGQLKKVTLPDNSYVSYSYDAAHRLTDITDLEGNRMHYILDAMGNRIQDEIYDPSNNLKTYVRREYNQLNRLRAVIGVNDQYSDYFYDAEGNLTLENLRAGTPGNYAYLATLHSYDALDRRKLSTGPDGSNLEYSYDGLDQLIAVEDPNYLTTQFTRNALGDETHHSSPDTANTHYTYDSAGNRKTAYDARGSTLTYSYDALNRVTRITEAWGENHDVSYRYDGSNYVGSVPHGIGRLTGVSNAADRHEYRYDARGNLIEDRVQSNHAQPMGTRIIGYSYDAADRLSSITYPSGRIISYARDAQGRITGVSSQLGAVTQTLVQNVGYMPFGALKTWQQLDGTITALSYDLSYRLTGISSGVFSRSYGYDPRDLITSITDTLDSGQSQSFSYNTVSRLQRAAGAYGSHNYGYDASGNRTSQAPDNADPEAIKTYSLQQYTHHLQGESEGERYTAHQYDWAGQLLGRATTVDDGNGGSTTVDQQGYSYNATARLQVQVKLIAAPYDLAANGPTDELDAPAPSSYRNEYNARGQRVYKARVANNNVYGPGEVSRFYLYDQQGHLIEEIDPNTLEVLAETIWLDDRPVTHYTRPIDAPISEQGNAALPTNGLKAYSIHADHLGTPQVLTTTNGTIAWKASYEPFGKTRQVTGNGLNNSASIVFNLRLPGQYFDAESGLYQNWNREYDPALGRYIQSDPIGLDGGINTYAYVGGNPLSFTDPQGLQATIPMGPLPTPLPSVAVPGTKENGDFVAAMSAAGNAIADAICPDPNDCEKLNQKVQAAKAKTSALGSCRAGMSRPELQQRLDAWLELASARAKRDMNCWAGGDSGHQQAQADAWANVGKCSSLAR